MINLKWIISKGKIKRKLNEMNKTTGSIGRTLKQLQLLKSGGQFKKTLDVVDK